MMVSNKPTFGRVSGYFAGHIVGLTFLFGIIAGAASFLDWLVKKLEPMRVRVPYFVKVLEVVAAFVFYADVLLYVVGILVAGGLYIRELRRCF